MIAPMRAASRIKIFASVMLYGALLNSQAQPFSPAPTSVAARSALPAKPISGPELLSELRKGGHVIYFRHAATDFSRDDSRLTRDDDCNNQRPLTEQGRHDARQIGEAFRQLGIPVGPVLASPRCRTAETAMLAFWRAHTTQDVGGGPAAPSSPERYAALRGLLTRPVPPGANVVIASHGNPFYATAGAPYLAEGEAAVLRPLGKDFAIVARIKHDAWLALAQPAESPLRH